MLVSPLNCIQELLPRDRDYPWRVMVTCILLNRTHGRQVRPMIDALWQIVPTPYDFIGITVAQRHSLQTLIRPLGFYVRRYETLVRNASDYRRGMDPKKCYGIGQYGRDAIDVFVHGRTDVEPTDTWLKPYVEWRRSGGSPLEWKFKEMT